MGFFDSWKLGIVTHLRNQVFYPGNIVEGYVEIKASAPVSFVAIRIKACGKERVTIRRREHVGTNSEGQPRYEIRTYRESNVVYKQLITLAGQLKCSGRRDTNMLPPGCYTYPFVFQLPVAIPPSFAKRASDDEADIMYYIKSYADIPMGRDAVHRAYFTVVKPMPQTQWIQRSPVSVERDWAVTCCCCISKGTVHGQLFMDRTMIAIDRDNLTVCANLDNTKGEEPVESIEISLMHNLQYRAFVHTENNTICEGKQFIKQGVAAGQKGQISGTIPLPRTIIPTLSTWNVTSEYYINIELNIPMASDPNQVFPVVIAQSVDETNFSPPCTFAQNPYAKVGKQDCPEFYYQPPPQPVYQCNPIPIPPPANVNMFDFGAIQPPSIPLPPTGWPAPTMYQQQGPPQQQPAQIQWQSGFQSQQHGFQGAAGGNMSTPLLQQQM